MNILIQVVKNRNNSVYLRFADPLDMSKELRKPLRLIKKALCISLNEEETQYALGMHDGSVELRPTQNILQQDDLDLSFKISNMPINRVGMFGKGNFVKLATTGGNRFEVRNLFMDEVIYEFNVEPEEYEYLDEQDHLFDAMLIHPRADENDERIIVFTSEYFIVLDPDQFQSKDDVASIRKFFNLFDISKATNFSIRDDLPNSGLLDWNTNMISAASYCRL